MRRFIAPRLGRTRLADITRNDIQDAIDGMVAEGYAPSTVRNAVLPLRSILRRALDRGEIETNPTERLDLPIDRRKKDRIAPPEEVDALLDALPEPSDLGTRRLHGPSAWRAPGTQASHSGPTTF
jgi:site-specific recombinase XerD